MLAEAWAAASGGVKTVLGKELSARPLELMASALGLLTVGAYFTDPSLPSHAAASFAAFLGFDVREATTAVHAWFTDPERASALTIIFAGTALVAYGTFAFVVSREPGDRRWAYDYFTDKEEARRNVRDIRSWATGRRLRCTLTWTICLGLLVEIHGLPGTIVERYGVALGLVVLAGLALAVDRMSTELDLTLGESLGFSVLTLLLAVALTVTAVAIIPLRIYVFLTTSSSHGRSNDDS